MGKLVSNTPYKHDIFTVKHYGEHTEKITYISTLREAGWEDNREYKPKCSVNDKKLDNNLSRAKSKVKEYAMCNRFDYWCTFTLDKEKYDRYNLKKFARDFSEFIHNYNRNCKRYGFDTYKVEYLLVPEKHKDDAWHMHGFIKGIRPQDLVQNEQGFMEWKQYRKKFGYISMDKIKDADRASSYILKYMTKDEEKNVTALGGHLYYCSKGLNTAVELYRGSGVFKGEYDWEHPEGYCKVKTIDTRKESIHDWFEVEEDDNTECV